MTTKERVIEQSEELDEAELLEIEKDLQSRATQKRIKRQLEALHGVIGIITDSEDVVAFEEATKRRPFFGSRKLDIEP